MGFQSDMNSDTPKNMQKTARKATQSCYPRFSLTLHRGSGRVITNDPQLLS